MNVKGETVFVGMSGGVDSSVVAMLLKDAGYDIRGVHIKMWSDPDIPCAFKEDRIEAMRAAAHLGIPFETWDLTAEYRQAVVEYMIAEYAAGRTPNPDVMCNRHIKFGAFLDRAIRRGADYIATGHYVRKLGSETAALAAARDLNKDQSYFLWTLTQEQLGRCLFPLGEHTKPEVRAMARSRGLPNAEKPDSQGICFIGEIDLKAFLKKHISVSRGAVRTTNGKTVGEHDGLTFHTIGERHGLGIGGGIPYYVAEKNLSTNTLVVAEGPYDDRLFSRELYVRDAHWISGAAPTATFSCNARIRYRQPLARCTVAHAGDGVLRVVFKEPQRAVTPGQSIVWYDDEIMLGGGIIA